MPDSDRDVTRILHEWSDGDPDALDRLTPLVVDELRRLARSHFQRESPGHTLQPTALVNEVFVRLLGRREVQWANRAQFFKYATQLMRHILIDHARRRRTARRGGDVPRVALDDESSVAVGGTDVDLLALNQALEELEREDPERRYLVELKFFLGLKHAEIAELLGISKDTVKLRWTGTKARLHRILSDS